VIYQFFNPIFLLSQTTQFDHDSVSVLAITTNPQLLYQFFLVTIYEYSHIVVLISQSPLTELLLSGSLGICLIHAFMSSVLIAQTDIHFVAFLSIPGHTHLSCCDVTIAV
jgi:hypothetical protein